MLQAIFGLFTKTPSKVTSVESVDSEARWSDRLKWSPTSTTRLLKAEEKILSFVKTPFSVQFVTIPSIEGSETCKIRTLYINDVKSPKKSRIPLVLLHGLGSAVGLWVLNLDALSKQGPVYALDILGFGASSRPYFSSDAKTAEDQLVQSIEQWRQAMELDSFILLGHSMGGFLATAYAMTFPNRIKHLILADPWGFPEYDKSLSPRRQIMLPFWVKAIISVMQNFNPLASLRLAGPWGPNLIAKIRPDILAKYQTYIEDPSIVSEYIYHCNAQVPSGETAFKCMSAGFGWAKNPMINRIGNLSHDIPITFIYGAQSWMDPKSGHAVKDSRKDSSVEVRLIIGAGHHIYGDQPEEFNDIVVEICDQVNLRKRVTEKCHLDTLSETLSEALDYSV